MSQNTSHAVMAQRVEVIGDCTVSFFDDETVVSVYAIGLVGGPPVYVGSTSQVLRHRIRAHAQDAKRGSRLPLHEWMRENTTFAVRVLERTTAPLRHVREQFWISQYAPALNVTDGGPGLSGHRFAGTEHAARIAAKIKTGVDRKCETCGKPFYRKLSQATKGNDLYCSRLCSNRRVRS